MRTFEYGARRWSGTHQVSIRDNGGPQRVAQDPPPEDTPLPRPVGFTANLTEHRDPEPAEPLAEHEEPCPARVCSCRERREPPDMPLLYEWDERDQA